MASPWIFFGLMVAGAICRPAHFEAMFPPFESFEQPVLITDNDAQKEIYESLSDEDREFAEELDFGDERYLWYLGGEKCAYTTHPSYEEVPLLVPPFPCRPRRRVTATTAISTTTTTEESATPATTSESTTTPATITESTSTETTANSSEPSVTAVTSTEPSPSRATSPKPTPSAPSSSQAAVTMTSFIFLASSVMLCL